jgi:uncharacterized membrane protein
MTTQRDQREQRPTGQPAAPPRSRGVGIAALVISIVGLGVASYLTYTHFTQTGPAFCSANSVVNCVEVTTSPESMIFGIPVAVLGLPFFVAMIALCLPPVWRARSSAVHLLRFAVVAVGVLFVVYLVCAELLLIGAICEYCTAVHILTLVLFVLVTTVELRRHRSVPAAE